MASKRPFRRRARIAQLDFGAIEIVGALITPGMVAKVAAGDASEQSKQSYGILPGLELRDEIARYYRIGEALWTRFAAVSDTHPESSTPFVIDLLKNCFGFDSLEGRLGLLTGGKVFPIRHLALGGSVPIVIAPATAEGTRKAGVDESLAVFGDGSRRRSATLLVQEYLNACDEARWGIACDGSVLRILRDNSSMTRPAWIEANLAKIFREGLFADFSALWLLAHQSRFGRPGEGSKDCALEHWRDEGREEGVTARENLRQGVKAALEELGQGFLEHPANERLRQALRSGTISRQDYYEELLRLVYRMIFLHVAEDRGLLHEPDTPEATRKRYAAGYSLSRLRDRCMRRGSWDRHGDAWEGMKALHRALATGEPRLGLTALGGLFAADVLPYLDQAQLSNRRLLAAEWRLCWIRPDGQSAMSRVNWRDMETEELGSVYESLLELIPRASADTRTFDFAPVEESRGSERKKTGSYYTPDGLVQLLLDAALNPVLDAAEMRDPEDPVRGILSLSIIDPACGSGHFLLGAARRAAERISRHRSPGAPSQTEFQHALREVVTHCIYGVDRNPMAVELCRVALWIEALEPGKPLTFLQSHIRPGDSLLGVFDLSMLRKGIPDAAYEELTGDDKNTAKAYASFNREGRDRFQSAGDLFGDGSAPTELIETAQSVFGMPEETLAEVEAKRAAFLHLRQGETWRNLALACDCYVTAFLAPKSPPIPTEQSLDSSPVPLTEQMWAAIRGRSVPDEGIVNCERTARRARPFHWILEFPDIFSRGGFDVVIGNPPWEVSQLSEIEYFSAKDPAIAALAGEARKSAIEALRIGNPVLWSEFLQTRRTYEAANSFFRASGRFERTAVGKVNSYALFCELFHGLTRHSGRSGVIAPTGIATDSSTSMFFGSLIGQGHLVALTDFENREAIFENVHRSYKFCVLVMGKAARATFTFFLTNLKQVGDPERIFTLAPDEIARLNPNTKTAPVFRSTYDATLTTRIYQNVPVLIEERPGHVDGDINPWGITFQQGLFNMTSASKEFADEDELLAEGWQRNGMNWELRSEQGEVLERRVPLYEAKMIHHYDHRWATYAGGATAGGASGAADDEDENDGSRYSTLDEKRNPDFEVTPRYWVPEVEVQLRAARVPATLKRAYREKKELHCLKSLAIWLAGYFQIAEGRLMGDRDLWEILGQDHDWKKALGAVPVKAVRTPKFLADGVETHRATPLTAEDVAFLQQGPREDVLGLVWLLLERKQPRWLMGWRDICRSTDERTVIAGVLPKVGVNHKAPLFYTNHSPAMACALVSNLQSLTLDYLARQKIGATSLTYFYLKQFAILPPSAYSQAEIQFIRDRSLELTYTSHSMKHWAEDLGYLGQPFEWNEDRRRLLRAELDAFFARKYGLSRDELRYLLDPADTKGPGYPSETFRVLRNKEEAQYGEFRTQRLVLEAWDRLGTIG